MSSDDPAAALTAEKALLIRRLDRERRIRRKAEDIAERGLRELYQSRHELAFLSEITTMANQAGSAREALAPALEYMCQFTGWPAAHAHVVAGDGLDRGMRPSNIWYCDPAVDISELRTATAEYVFSKGEGLPGRVWESGTPVWLEDIAGSDNFPRRDAAVRSGMRAAFSTPLMIGSDVAGALEFFNPNPMPEDPGLLALMARAGTQLGRLLERDAANARLTTALAHSEQISALLRTKIDTMMDPQAMIEPIRDSGGQIVDFVCVDANRAACWEFGLPLHEVRGRRHLELFPDGANSGFTAMFTRCVEDGESIAFDEVPYGQDLPGGVRYYDIRAVRIGSESVNTTWRDVTERARLSRDLARALADSERAHALARANTDALMDPQVLLEGVRDTSGRIVDLVYRDVNVATCLDIGLSRDELIGHSCLESRPKLRGSGLLAHVIDSLENRRPLVLDDVSYQSEPCDPMRYYDVRASYAGADSISITWRDVTARVTAAQRIAESEERFRLLAENAGDVVVHVRDGRFVWISPSVEGVLGRPAEYWTGRDVQEMAVPGDRRRLTARLREVAESGPLVTRARVLAADGTTHWIALHANPFLDAHGQPDGVTASFRVIDDEVEARREAGQARELQAEADARYRKLTEHSAVGMCLVDPYSGRYEMANQALCDFFGYDEDTLLQMTWQETTAAEYLEPDLERLDNLVAGRIDAYRMTKQYIHADGRLIWGDLTVSAVRNPNGQLENLISQIVDVTAEMETRSRIAQREQQNRVLARRLQAQTDRLMAEINSAARYVASILPGELGGPVRVTSRYLPSRELAGDCFDYSWIDDDHLIFYVIDVSGHGIEPSMVSISVHNLLRSKSLAAETLLEPDRVLAELNKLFDMDRHGGNYFTMWYGVYQSSSRTLRYASAGHPPALAFAAANPGTHRDLLSTEAQPVGMFDDTEFPCGTYIVPPGSQILLYSDGVFELPLASGRHWSLSDFIDLCTGLAADPDWSLDTLISRLRAVTASGMFDDDCSVVRLTFD
ncbi:MAG: PAS domain S-box protein [Actinomycetota bacterium]|nr:PAS domain S-box protein [Actinomycetota bacterium]MDA2948432.1 PAS domain S-box protein [Actinomycetota bacterium]